MTSLQMVAATGHDSCGPFFTRPNSCFRSHRGAFPASGVTELAVVVGHSSSNIGLQSKKVNLTAVMVAAAVAVVIRVATSS